MTDDPNKKQNDPNYSGGQTGQGKQPEQQRKNPDDSSQKRPSQGGHDVEPHHDEQDQSGKRRAS